jgi:hypothetical protein
VLADGRSVIANSKGVKWDRRFSVYHSPLIAVVCRAIYTEHRLGSALEYDDPPESLQTFYYPTCIQDTDGKGYRYEHAKLACLVLGIDESPTFDFELAQQFVPLDAMAKILEDT